MVDVGGAIAFILLWPIWVAIQAQPLVGTLGAWVIGIILWCVYYGGLGWGYAARFDPS